ncbi:MAG: hypothetical protein ACUVXA_13815 [Candidatus Jordarchaeum sp.]|uniref:hypothetical protein n=1 Tax=Candidatus Jordarchaeum sp. TaxID=2823881 RepID=UPI00404AB84A
MTILDDEKPKNFLKRNFPQLLARVTGTIGFIESCTCRYRIFSKEEAINILCLIKKSKFRVREEIVNGAIEKIRKE